MKHSAKDEDLDLPGYGDYSVFDEKFSNRVTLLLPSSLLQALRDEHLAAEAAKKAQDEAEQQAAHSEELRSAALIKPRPAYGVPEFDVVAESKELTQEAAGKEESAETVTVHDVLEPLKLIKDLKSRTPDKEIHKRNELLYKQLKTKGHYRALAQPVIGRRDFKRLCQAFPHFMSVLELVPANLIIEDVANSLGIRALAGSLPLFGDQPLQGKN